MNEPVRVLQVTGTMNRAGAETFVMNLYRALDRDRVQFDFVGFGDDRGDFDDEIEQMGGRIQRLDDRGFLARLRAFDNLLESANYPIVHSHIGMFGAWLVSIAARRGVAHRWLHSHNANLHSGPFPFAYKFSSRRLARRFATRRFSCGRLASQEMFGGPAMILNNSVALDDFSPDASVRARVREELQVQGHETLVLHVARLAPVKNQEFTAAIAACLSPNDNVKIVTVGTGDNERQWRQKIMDKNLSPQLCHVGLRSDIPDLMRAADVMILPSHHEGFPVVAVEAQAAGLQCVFSRHVDPDVDCDLGLAEFLPIDEPERWVERIKARSAAPVMEFPERRKKLADLGFDVEVLAERYTELVEATVPFP